MKKILITLIVLIFVLGWYSSSVWSDYLGDSSPDSDNVSKDYDTSTNKTENTSYNLIKEFEKIQELFTDENKERDKPSPHDIIKQNQIYVYHDHIIIKVDNPEWAIFTDTKSMDPVIDSTANALEFVPSSKDDIHVGDIVAYRSEYKDGVITHRVTEISHDSKGWYAILKGDNNDRPDPGKIRFSQIERVLFGIIY